MSPVQKRAAPSPIASATDWGTAFPSTKTWHHREEGRDHGPRNLPTKHTYSAGLSSSIKSRRALSSARRRSASAAGRFKTSRGACAGKPGRFDMRLRRSRYSLVRRSGNLRTLSTAPDASPSPRPRRSTARDAHFRLSRAIQQRSSATAALMLRTRPGSAKRWSAGSCSAAAIRTSPAV
jgi:hypothetical protein